MSRTRIDPVVFFSALGLNVFGVVMVFSASQILALDRYGDSFYFVKRHVMWAAVGFALMLLLARANVRKLRHLAFPILVLSFVVLALVFAPGIGRTAGGARRWIVLGPLSFQPAEAAKFGLLFFLAHFLAVKGERLDDLRYGFMPPVLITAMGVLLILAQPDLGTAMLLTLVAGMMLFLAGARWHHLLGCALTAAPVFYWLVFSVPWRRKRILAFLDPFGAVRETGYQLVQSLLALGRGGLTGLGLGEGKQKLLYLPEPHTDFIFAVIGEELGLIGTLAVAAVFAVILWRGLRIAARCEDGFRFLLASGLTLMVAVQGLLNMAVAAGLVPTKGVPLPLISLGGTSLVFTLAALGLLLAVEAGTRPAPAQAAPMDAAASWPAAGRAG
ncbi:MAG: cell division protein FtsW [Candidatus Tectomicrobia bacterium RIFCSPLOWO2_12_FULL_69_37]|nr:MAG: cell division protein FtsW [Candidatus Tectomicrobia bacterium RIFCSPLOWO2_12_FULL_69_37]